MSSPLLLGHIGSIVLFSNIKLLLYTFTERLILFNLEHIFDVVFLAPKDLGIDLDFMLDKSVYGHNFLII